MTRSLIADLRLGFSLGALAIGLSTSIFADVSLRHSMGSERGIVLDSEGHRILRTLLAAQQPSLAVPESTLVDWRLVDEKGHLIMASAGAEFLNHIPWSQVGASPAEIHLNNSALYSALSLPSPLGTFQCAMDRSPEILVISHLRRDLAIMLLLLTVSAAVLGHTIAKRGLRPLRKIRDETALIEAQDLSRRLDAASFPEELADLVDALNGTLERLEAAFLRLESFSSDLAHEFRTPMQNLRSELEGWILRPKDASHVPEFLGSLLEELDRLDHMVEQMLFLARTSVPGMALDRQPLAVGKLFREGIAFFGAAAEEAKVGFQLEVEPSDLVVFADPRLLHRALQNLIANALRHSPPGSRITLSGLDSSEGTDIAIADTGRGIPEDLLPRLGDRFLRRDVSRNRSTGGAGLGLAIVKGIVTLHGGTLQVDSEVGKGTKLRLHFPAGP